MHGFILAQQALRERKERIRKEKIAATLSPLAWRVAARFMDEYDTELVDKSDSDLLEMIKTFGANTQLTGFVARGPRALQRCTISKDVESS